MLFPLWKATQAAGNRNSAKFLTAFCAGLSTPDQAAALSEDKHALILAHLLSKSMALHLYHNFVNFDRLWTCPKAKLAV